MLRSKPKNNFNKQSSKENWNDYKKEKKMC